MQLTALGFLLGFAYVRSRNLLTPMLIHGAWNGTVLTILFLLASQVGISCWVGSIVGWEGAGLPRLVRHSKPLLPGLLQWHAGA